MNNEHTRGVIGDRPGEKVDRAWKVFSETVAILGGTSHVVLDNMLFKAMEQHAYAITGKLFGQTRPDVVNEALTRAWQGLGKFQGRSRFSTWFHRIVVNVSKAHGAKETERRKREVPLSDVAVAKLYAYAETGYPTLEKAILILNEDEWAFFQAKMTPLPDAEVAIKWGLSLSGVRGKWHRIKRKIQAALE